MNSGFNFQENDQMDNNYNENDNLMNYHFLSNEKSNSNSNDLFGQNSNDNMNNEGIL